MSCCLSFFSLFTSSLHVASLARLAPCYGYRAPLRRLGTFESPAAAQKLHDGMCARHGFLAR